ncbi:anti-sigma factor family protein [Microvirga terricola]|uniref:Anti-sigma factor n=1 Tax=Microvirga terricola TaxID=2719797 RepID=A0ABX0V837_9HYPH|nr:anti-sigma factor [Microvirga terricola]NIX75862.1 anti-sigma factor [Microvirga terricola]
MSSRPITEDDLNAFVDGRLDVPRRKEVIAYLEAHPDVAQRIALYTEQRDMLRTALQPIAEEPIPPELDVSRMIWERRRPRTMPRWAGVAAAVALMIIGGAGGWILRGLDQPSSATVQSLAREAAASYFAYAPDLVRPVEIRADDSKTLAAWTAKRVGRPIAIPDLAASGYHFMGGRVVPTDYGPAALFMYDNDRGTRLVILARPIEAAQELPMSPVRQGGVNGFAWVGNGLGYSIVGPVQAEALRDIADDARRQVGTHA